MPVATAEAAPSATAAADAAAGDGVPAPSAAGAGATAMAAAATAAMASADTHAGNTDERRTNGNDDSSEAGERGFIGWFLRKRKGKPHSVQGSNNPNLNGRKSERMILAGADRTCWRERNAA